MHGAKGRSSLAISLASTLILMASMQIRLMGQSSISKGPGTLTVSLGSPLSPLYGPWKFHLGDSPIDSFTHTPLWADPTFDDSQWETIDLTPKDKTAKNVPGWTARGHAHYSGYAWYRLHLETRESPDRQLAITWPVGFVQDACQVFGDGQLLGNFGDFKGKTPSPFPEIPTLFRLPQPVIRAAGRADQVLAFRVWMDSETLTDPEAGGLRIAPKIGLASTAEAEYKIGWFNLLRDSTAVILDALALGLLSLMAFSLILFDPADAVYFWIGVSLLGGALWNVLWLLCIILPFSPHLFWLIASPLPPIGLATWGMVWWVWYGRPKPSWLPWGIASCAAIYLITTNYPYLIFHSLFTMAQTLSLIARILAFVLLGWIVFLGVRRQGLEGWLAVPFVLLLGVAHLSDLVSKLHIQLTWSLFGAYIDINQASDLAVVVALAVLLLRRLRHSVQRQRLMALDFKQAQEVQQVILPEAVTMIPGFTIESEYRPAREVGGDFFQVIPHAADGSLLVVAGDVTGKGLKAGMLVALLVGAIRTAADISYDPEMILRALNKRLLGRGDSQATCLALTITADGQVLLANAGHMPPYLNGQPLPMEGALPLGIMDGADLSVMRFQLSESDRLVLLSDGVPEAMNPEGHLFGFERISDLLRDAATASEVANAAQRFGQEDDISVIHISRQVATV